VRIKILVEAVEQRAMRFQRAGTEGEEQCKCRAPLHEGTSPMPRNPLQPLQPLQQGDKTNGSASFSQSSQRDHSKRKRQRPEEEEEEEEEIGQSRY
jgi:hypothetical protein